MFHRDKTVRVIERLRNEALAETERNNFHLRQKDDSVLRKRVYKVEDDTRWEAAELLKEYLDRFEESR